MKKFNLFAKLLFCTCVLFGVSAIVSAQTYDAPNYINTDFNEGEFEYTVNEADGATIGDVAYWKTSWNWLGELEYDGWNLVANTLEGCNFDSWTARGTIITTPQILLNTIDYPYLAVRIAEKPETGEDGEADDGRIIRAGLRLQLITRAATSSTGNNQDFYLAVDPANVYDTDYCQHMTDLTDFETVYLFNLLNGPERWNKESIYVPQHEALVVDIVLVVVNALNEDDYLKVDYVKSFKSPEEFNTWSYNRGNASSIADNTFDTTYAYADNQTIFVKGIQEGVVELYDLSGQLVVNQSVNSDVELSAVPGIYILKTKTEQGTKTFKIVNR